MTDTPTTRVLFVCLGNICRSPTAEGVFRALCERERLDRHIAIDSAGTAAWHAGKPPDARAMAAAARRGVDLSPLRARQVADRDFADFDWLLAMDLDNLDALRARCPPQAQRKLGLFLDFAPDATLREVPDPYYGGEEGFDTVLDLVESASEGLLRELRTRHGLP